MKDEGTTRKINGLANLIRKKFRPEKIILFGSHAYGDPSQDSDIDILVVMDTPLPLTEQAFLIRRELDKNISIDVIVRTPAQVAQRLQLGDFFIKQVLAKGISL